MTWSASQESSGVELETNCVAVILGFADPSSNCEFMASVCGGNCAELCDASREDDGRCPRELIAWDCGSLLPRWIGSRCCLSLHPRLVACGLGSPRLPPDAPPLAARCAPACRLMRPRLPPDAPPCPASDSAPSTASVASPSAAVRS